MSETQLLLLDDSLVAVQWNCPGARSMEWFTLLEFTNESYAQVNWYLFFHTAAVVPEMTSELEQLKKQVEKLPKMVAAILSVSSVRSDSVTTVGVLGTFSEIVHSVISVTHVVGPDTLQRIVVRETT